MPAVTRPDVKLAKAHWPSASRSMLSWKRFLGRERHLRSLSVRVRRLLHAKTAEAWLLGFGATSPDLAWGRRQHITLSWARLPGKNWLRGPLTHTQCAAKPDGARSHVTSNCGRRRGRKV